MTNTAPRGEPRILAIETTGMSGSVAACLGSRTLEQRPLEASQRSAQSLAPAMRDLIAAAGWRMREVQLVAVAVGPGSFTGLRVGVTTAKTFAYAIGAEVIGVNTLDCIARQATTDWQQLSAAIDAQRQQVFVRNYRRDARAVVPTDEPQILDVDTWLAALAPGVVVSGPALEKLTSRLPAGVELANASTWSPRASTVGLLGFERYAAGARDDLWTLVPFYLRASAAEEKFGK